MFRPAFAALRPQASRIASSALRREAPRAFSTSLRHQAGGGRKFTRSRHLRVITPLTERTMIPELYPVTQPPHWPSEASRNNATGTDAEVLDRFKIREICEGWGCYRDAAEWENYRSMVRITTPQKGNPNSTDEQPHAVPR